MLSAEVGDDVYAEDPQVRALEEQVAALLGHQAGLFCVSGSMANQLGVALQVPAGAEVVCDARAHIARAEMGAHALLHGTTMRTWQSGRGDNPPGVADLAEIAAMLAPDAGPYLVSTALIAMENTHNFGGGTIQPIEHLRSVRQLADEAGIAVHLDGARLANAHVATGVGFAEYGALFDTVSLCLSKGLGAPIGSVLVGDAALVAEARVLRKRLGGGWRQAGMLAAAGRFALDHQLQRLADDHEAAWQFADQVRQSSPDACDLPQTNIVVVDTGDLAAAAVAEQARERGVLLSVVAARQVRAVTHLDVTVQQAADAGMVLGRLLAGG